MMLLRLDYWGWVMHICVGNLGRHWFRWWLVTYAASSHYLNQCWNVVNWTLGNKRQWNFNRNTYIFIQENSFEDVVWKMVAISSQPQCVNHRCVLFFQVCKPKRNGRSLRIVHLDPQAGVAIVHLKRVATIMSSSPVWTSTTSYYQVWFSGMVQDCDISIAKVLEILLSCT